MATSKKTVVEQRITLYDGRHLLAYNHNGNDRPDRTDKGYRSPLNLAISKDGNNWEAVMVLEHEPKQTFGYPAIIQTRDGLVHVTYSWKELRIKHLVFDPSRFVTKPIINGQWP